MKPYKLLYLFLLLIASSCTLDVIEPMIPVQEDECELPIDFTFVLADEDFDTRGISNPKTSFQVGDIIHIQGIFNALYNEEETVITRYGALRKVNNGWDTVPGSKMKWPNMATTGTFTAYYISGTSGLLTVGEPVVTSLSNLDTDSDPLMAQSAQDIAYGRGVRMQFNHLCTYLTLEDLEPMVANSYWITSTDDATSSQIKNAFSINLASNNELSFEFLSIPDENYKDMVYVAGEAINTESSAGGELVTNTHANFFLAPGTYDSFMIRYPGINSESYEFLKYEYQTNADDEESVAPVLEAGKTYLLNVTKSPGITILSPPSAEGWDESDKYYSVDVPDFLQAVYEGNDYINSDDVLILEKTASGVRLLHNVDFNFEQYNGIFETFDANINEGQVFDGNYHYIRNIGSPVFRYNYGTIRNIGLKSLNVTFVTDENDDTGHDMSRQGVMCQWNRLGTIENLRIPEGGVINGLVNQAYGAMPEDETHNIGIVTGSNTGSINGVELGGSFTLTVTGYYTDTNPEPAEVNVTVLTGGLTGQNTGSVSNINSPDNNLNLTIYNKCQGSYGALYTGGLVGSNTGSITDVVIQTITVDCSDSEGLTLYSGGLTGELTASATNQSIVNNCMAQGTLISGVAKYTSGDAQSGCYNGGLTGVLQNIPVTDARISVDIQGPSVSNDNVLYGTGGVFGRIRTNTSVSDIIAYGTRLSGVPYIGNFAGIVPEGMSWTDYEGKGIIVRAFPSINNIGTDASIITD